MNSKAVDQQIIRETNQYLMLDLIRKNKSVTRAFLSSELKLSAPSVSSNIEKMIQKGILVEKGIDQSDKEKLGRKGIIIELIKDFAYIVSVDLSGTSLKVAISNIYEEMIGFQETEILENDNCDSINKKMIQLINQTLKKYRIKKDSIAVIVVAYPGVINEVTGEIKYVPKFTGWGEINLKEYLEKHYKANVVIRNDINLIAIGEAQYGIGRDVQNFVHINVEVGVGAGLILNKKLYSGSHFAGGEICFMMPSEASLEEFPDKGQGLLESLIAIPQIKKNIAQALGRKKEEITIGVINQLYKEGNGVVKAEIQRVARVLAIAIVNIVALLDVELIVLGGSITRLDVDLVEKIKSLIQNIVPFVPDIKFSNMENNSCIKGAFAIGAEQIIKELVRK